MTLPSKIFWGIVGALFLTASIAIQYHVKYLMHHQRLGSVQTMGQLKVGQPAPDFTLMDLTNHPVTLSGYRSHKVVLMDFWATWCGPCRMAMPDLQDMADKFNGGNFEILSVNQGEEADQVRNFIQREKYTFHVVLDGNNAVGGSYGVEGIPTLVLVDKKGVVQWLQVGYSDNDDDLRKLVGRLIKE